MPPYNNQQWQPYLGPGSCFIPQFYGRHAFPTFVPPLAAFPFGFPGDYQGRPEFFMDAASFGCPMPAHVSCPASLPNFGFSNPSTLFSGIPLNRHRSPPTESISAVHPLLVGDYGRRPKIIFDLSLHTFRAQYMTRSGSHSSQLRLEELSEPAVYPLVPRLKIVCDHLLEWPITIEHRLSTSSGTLDARGGDVTLNQSPITVYDVLIAIHRTLHEHITLRDWDKLHGNRRWAVVDAYTRRCRRYIGFRWGEDVGGIRRVDYLQDHYMFGGIARQHTRMKGAEMKLLLTTTK